MTCLAAIAAAGVLTACGGGTQAASPSGPTPTAGPRTTFGSGSYRVNVDIVAGRYFAAPRAGCSFERGGDGGPKLGGEAFAVDHTQWIVEIDASDTTFKTNDACGTWTKGEPRAGTLATIPTGGMWVVGTQIPPGRYRQSPVVVCFWYRLRDFGSSDAAFIDKGVIDSEAPAVVEVASTDAGFVSSTVCSEWKRVQ